VYSDTRLGVLFENDARIATLLSLLLFTRKIIETELLDTLMVFSSGMLGSSGTAEVNSQSSSVVDRFIGWVVVGGWG